MKLAALLLLLAVRPAAAEQCYADWRCRGPQCANVMGGWSGTGGPMGSMSECESWKRKYITNATCRCSAGGSSGSSSGGGGTLQEQAVGHLVNGAFNGNIQQFNLGAAGLLGAGIGAALRGDPAAAARAEAARQAAAQEAARQAAIRKQRFEAGKQDLLRQMDDGGNPTGSGGFAFKDDDDLNLPVPSHQTAEPRNCERTSLGQPVTDMAFGSFKSGVNEALWGQEVEWDKRPISLEVRASKPVNSFDDALSLIKNELGAAKRTATTAQEEIPLKSLPQFYAPGILGKLGNFAKKQATSEVMDMAAEGKEYRKKYEEFLKNTRQCLSRKEPEDFNKCVDLVTSNYSKVLESLAGEKFSGVFQARDLLEAGATKALEESVRQITDDVGCLSK